MAANLVLKRLNIVQSDGWVRLAAEPVVVKGVLECLSSTISIRWRGGVEVLLRNNGSYPVDGVDLSELEISSSTISQSGFVVFCQARN